MALEITMKCSPSYGERAPRDTRGAERKASEWTLNYKREETISLSLFDYLDSMMLSKWQGAALVGSTAFCIIQLAGLVARPVPVILKQLDSSSENSPADSPRRYLSRHHDTFRHRPGTSTNAESQAQPQHKGLNPNAEPFLPLSSISRVALGPTNEVPYQMAADRMEMHNIHTFLANRKAKYLQSVGVDPATAQKEPVYALPTQMYQRHRPSPSSSVASSGTLRHDSEASKPGEAEKEGIAKSIQKVREYRARQKNPS